ncbi:MAG TPA: CNNM domain-containing protein, partial [Promineifilum sp.]|nr:CNNM domain-containing protein [Promineifilum sp.]
MSRYLLFGLALPGIGLFFAVAPAAGSLPSPSGLLLPAIVIVALVLINAVFVAAEFAIAGVRDTELEQLADEGNRAAGNMLRMLESQPRLDHYVATAQLIVTLASLSLAMYGVPIIARFAAPYLLATGLEPGIATWAAYLIAILILAYLHVVIGEMAPRALAISNPAGTALALDRIMRLAGRLFGLPVRVLNGIGGHLLRAFRITSAQGQPRLMAAEELELIV